MTSFLRVCLDVYHHVYYKCRFLHAANNLYDTVVYLVMTNQSPSTVNQAIRIRTTPMSWHVQCITVLCKNTGKLPDRLPRGSGLTELFCVVISRWHCRNLEGKLPTISSPFNNIVIMVKRHHGVTTRI